MSYDELPKPSIEEHLSDVLEGMNRVESCKPVYPQTIGYNGKWYKITKDSSGKVEVEEA
jgi:hypothetical protein